MDQKGNPIRKVVVTGPESSGKTTLARRLAERFQTVWVPEFARTWGEQLNRPFQADDIPSIAIQQQAMEKEACSKARHWLFCDTGPVVLRVWETIKFNQRSKTVESWLETSDHHLFLLCRPDIPWEEDPLREDPKNRAFLFQTYLSVLSTYQLPFQIVEGNDRLDVALAILAEKGC